MRMVKCNNCGIMFDLDEVMETEFEMHNDIFEYRDIVPEWENQELCEECAYELLGCCI